MSRHFVIEIDVALPGEDDELEEGLLASLREGVTQLPESQQLDVSVGEPRRI